MTGENFGDELRRLRAAAGYGITAFSLLIHYDKGYLSKVERGLKAPTIALAKAADQALGSGHRLESIAATARNATLSREPVPSDGVITVPVISDGRTAFVPLDRRSLLRLSLTATAGIAVTSAGGRAGSASLDPSIADTLLDLRSALVRSDSLLGPGRLLASVYEQVTNVSELLGRATGSLRTQLFEVGSLYAEFQGWLCDDLGDMSAGRSWSGRALEWAEAAGSDSLAAYTLMRMSQQAELAGDRALVLGLATAALRRDHGTVTPQVRAAAAQQSAHGHALNGDEAAALKALDESLELVVDPGTDDEPDRYKLASYCTPTYVHAQRGACLTVLNRHDQALDAYDEALRHWPREYRRERGLHLARKTIAAASAGRVDDAVEAGTEALSIAQDTGSTRTITELRRASARMGEWSTNADVREFREALTTTSPNGASERG